jgi:hypothetical protein
VAKGEVVREVFIVGGERHGEVLTVREDHHRLSMPGRDPFDARFYTGDRDPFAAPVVRTVTMNIEGIPLSHNRSVWFAAAPHLHRDTARAFVADEIHAAWQAFLAEPNRRRTRVS